MNIIIMADGLGSRWDNPEVQYKQLIDINGTPLIVRTINQLKKYTSSILVVAPEKFEPYIPTGVPVTSLGYRESQNRPLLDGILRTQPFWDSPVTIVLGDVIFSNYAIDCLFNVELECWILGRTKPNRITGKVAGELFAIQFWNIYNFEDDLWTALQQSGEKLWDFHRIIRPSIIELNDYTDDLDSPQAYEEFYGKMLEAVNTDS